MSNKLKKKPSTRLSPETMTAAEVSGITGVKLEILRKWVDRMQRNLSEAYQKEAQEKLLKAEDCISAAKSCARHWRSMRHGGTKRRLTGTWTTTLRQYGR